MTGKLNMQTLDIALDLYQDSLKKLITSVQAIPEEAMTRQPAGQVNHPAWMLSHLANAAAAIAFLLDEPCADVGADDMKHYGPGSVPVADPARYASKAELIDRLTRRHEIVDRLVRTKHHDYFSKVPPAPFDQFAPSIGRIVLYLLAAHESYHLGQLMDWLRVGDIRKA